MTVLLEIDDIPTFTLLDCARERIKTIGTGYCWYCRKPIYDHNCKYSDGRIHPELKRRESHAGPQS